MTGMILAAGLGLRLRPLTNHTPKPLLPIGGRPIIHYQLKWLKEAGIVDIIINVHHLGEKIVTEVGDGARFGVNITYSRESDILGTGGGIKKVEALMKGAPFLVMNGDVLIHLNFQEVVALHKNGAGAATLVVRRDPDAVHYGPIHLNAQNRIVNILNQIPQGSYPHSKEFVPYMFTGVHVIGPRVFDFIPSEGRYSIIDAYIGMLRCGEKLMGYITDGYWNDIGVMERYQQAERDIAMGAIQCFDEFTTPER